jgi:hypothetical protein
MVVTSSNSFCLAFSFFCCRAEGAFFLVADSDEVAVFEVYALSAVVSFERANTGNTLFTF